MIAIVVITHGSFGCEMLRTAQDMIGRQELAVGLCLTADMGREGLAKLLAETEKGLEAAEGLLYLVDMLGGTPCNTVLLFAGGKPAEAVAGVNLYMVLSALKNRQSMPLGELAARVAEDGRKAIVLPKDLLAKRGG